MVYTVETVYSVLEAEVVVGTVMLGKVVIVGPKVGILNEDEDDVETTSVGSTEITDDMLADDSVEDGYEMVLESDEALGAGLLVAEDASVVLLKAVVGTDVVLLRAVEEDESGVAVEDDTVDDVEEAPPHAPVIDGTAQEVLFNDCCPTSSMAAKDFGWGSCKEPRCGLARLLGAAGARG